MQGVGLVSFHSPAPFGRFYLNMKNFIASKRFQDKSYQIYEFNGRGHYLDLNNPDLGFSDDYVKLYSHAFLFGDSLAEIQENVRVAEYKLKYGSGETGDVQCPNCRFWHSFDYIDYNDGYYTPGINECFSEYRTCLCGKRFNFAIKEVKVVWETKQC